MVGQEATPDDPLDPAALDTLTLTVHFVGDNVNDSNVTFDATLTSLAEIAAEIRTQTIGASTAPAKLNMTVEATADGKLRILPGVSPTPGIVNVLTVTGGTAAAMLGFDDAATIGEPPVVSGADPDVDVLLAGGVDHGDPGNADYTSALQHLRDYRDVTILMLRQGVISAATTARSRPRSPMPSSCRTAWC